MVGRQVGIVSWVGVRIKVAIGVRVRAKVRNR